jgi:hypothetical protein
MAIDLSNIPPEQIRLLSKLGSIAVHIGELFGPHGAPEDKIAIESLLNDPDIIHFLKDMGPLVPEPRNKSDEPNT